MTPYKYSVRIQPDLSKEKFIGKRTRRNEQITAKEVRVIDSEGEQLGVMSKDEALKKAKEAGLDLIEVAPKAKPPVVKILDWGKYLYEQSKQLKKSKKKQKQPDLKQIRFGLKIGDHDLDVKLRKVREFLEDGDKVKVSAYFKGREMAHKELGYELLDKITNLLENEAVVDQKPKLQGRYLSMTLRRDPSAKTKDS